MTKIIKHNEFEDTYDDPDHPIPSLTHLEVCKILKGGGAVLAIVISQPLQPDAYSLNRLLGKIEAYLRYILSDEFIEEAGDPNSSNTTIEVHIHPDSCKEAFILLDKSSTWVESNNASLKITIL